MECSGLEDFLYEMTPEDGSVFLRSNLEWNYTVRACPRNTAYHEPMNYCDSVYASQANSISKEVLLLFESLNLFCQTQLSRNSVILSLMFHFSLVALYHIMYNGEPIYKTKPKYFEMLIPFSWGVIYSLLCLWLCHHRLQPIEVATKQIYLLNSYLWLRILKYYAIRNDNNGYITK